MHKDECQTPGELQGKARQVYLYSTFQLKAIQSALQKGKTLRALRNSATHHIIKWHLKTVIQKQTKSLLLALQPGAGVGATSEGGAGSLAIH